MKNISSSVLFIISLLLFSCTGIKDLEVKEIKSFKVNQINTEGIDSELLLLVSNPNHFGFKIYPSEFDVTYSNIYLGKAKLLNQVKIKNNVEETYGFVLKNEFKDVNLIDVMKLLGSSGFENLIEIKGEIKAGKFLMKKKFKVDYKDKIPFN